MYGECNRVPVPEDCHPASDPYLAFHDYSSRSHRYTTNSSVWGWLIWICTLHYERCFPNYSAYSFVHLLFWSTTRCQRKWPLLNLFLKNSRNDTCYRARLALEQDRTVVRSKQKWTDLSIDKWRLLATFVKFAVVGVSDGVYEVSPTVIYCLYHKARKSADTSPTCMLWFISLLSSIMTSDRFVSNLAYQLQPSLGILWQSFS